MLAFTNLSWRFLTVWRRNLVVYRKIWKVNFLVPLLEPAFYILAFGLGFQGLIEGLSYAGQPMAYTKFMAPALIAISIMYNSFFETTYASFVRMYYQKTFDGMMATPLSLEEIILAEIVWSATKATAAALIMAVVLGLFGFVAFPQGLLLLPLAFLGGLAFGAVGMFFTGFTPSIDMFNLPIFLFITPMFLFSGTFFPTAGLPVWAQHAAYAFPLYHLVELTRFCCLGFSETSPWASLAYLFCFALIFLVVGLMAMRRRLIK
ncbi:MAG: ABC transporter permease [Desulfobulbus sp.]|jgi:lipooligosaccharide transport system permease protein|uniref:ABC transporter permease n=1 Tax=Desulfobulbus sp. TaxID=895 RepID=UPI00284B55CB|nr:ABC transporter permease [Desulfobulbus sp.]MDR2549310.1 ABC transporter permease [Desulfobulbus sp.]